ncbi:winged helix-turn-helix domain-containing protein [Rhizobium sp. CNPSo 3968]|uniref:winged helix-turn-helix domain-containing protein n=1 Tax=Rhizobium sp. CNPSo 3968 TaxID=3021408 RepID=UPI00254DDB60|nr:winged helix-turn-helix domain-containing protein [Rhizobium sp. CNPSo 3968]MDK4720887.1 winged helix-turn-helix domain-containing protein [Rhizobium sp. CNPSo 3968]
MAKSDKLFVTEAECAERIGISTDGFKGIVSELTRQGFPAPDPLFANRRYWPAVRAFLDQRYGLGDRGVHSPYAPDGVEKWKQKSG